MKDAHRWHEMTYAEIGNKYAQVAEERDKWKQIASLLTLSYYYGEDAWEKALRTYNDAMEMSDE